MEKKMTKKEMFAEVIAMAKEKNREDIVAFAEHEIELLDHKRKSKGMTKTQQENEEYKKSILATLVETGKAMTISEIQAENEVVREFSTSKMSALLSQLVKADKVEKEYLKKKAYFSAIAE